MAEKGRTLFVKDVQEILRLSSSGANNLFHAWDFPSFRIGRRLMVMECEFDKWLQKQTEKQL